MLLAHSDYRDVDGCVRVDLPFVVLIVVVVVVVVVVAVVVDIEGYIPRPSSEDRYRKEAYWRPAITNVRNRPTSPNIDCAGDIEAP